MRHQQTFALVRRQARCCFVSRLACGGVASKRSNSRLNDRPATGSAAWMRLLCGSARPGSRRRQHDIRGYRSRAARGPTSNVTPPRIGASLFQASGRPACRQSYWPGMTENGSKASGSKELTQLRADMVLEPLPTHSPLQPQPEAPHTKSILVPAAPLSRRLRWNSARRSSDLSPTRAAKAGIAPGSPASSLLKALP